jgi:hypothetical protein
MGAAMSAPTRDTTALDHDITEALAELRGARHDHAHCPSSDNELTVAYAERRLNRLLDRRADAVR